MIEFTYTNHRGETELRKVTPVAICYFHNPASVSPHLVGYKPGLFLECVTHDRGNDLRHFAVERIIKGLGKLDWRMTFSHPNEDRVPPSDMRAYRAGYSFATDGEPYPFGNSPDFTRGYNDGRRARLLDRVRADAGYRETGAKASPNFHSPGPDTAEEIASYKEQAAKKDYNFP